MLTFSYFSSVFSLPDLRLRPKVTCTLPRSLIKHEMMCQRGKNACRSFVRVLYGRALLNLKAEVHQFCLFGMLI